MSRSPHPTHPLSISSSPLSKNGASFLLVLRVDCLICIVIRNADLTPDRFPEPFANFFSCSAAGNPLDEAKESDSGGCGDGGGFATDMGISGRGGSGSSRSGSGAANDEERELAEANGAWWDTSDPHTSLQDAGFWMEDEEFMAQLEVYYKLTNVPQADGSLYAASLDEIKVGG